MTTLRLQIVGESVIEVGEKRVTPASPQLFALLLVLGLEHHREVSRNELIELLYPESAPLDDSLHRLRQTLYKVRTMGAPISVGEGGVRASSSEVLNAVTLLLTGGWEARRDHLVHSFEILSHYSPPAGTRLREWVERQREQLHHAIRQQLVRDFDIARHRADWRHLEALARRTLELDSLNESAILALAEATARTGSKALAMSILDAYRSELGESRSNLALPAALLEKRIVASRDRSPASRRALVPMIGREQELASLLSQWQGARNGGALLVWLNGNKSVGKSRLAEEFASNALLGGSAHAIKLDMSPMDQDRPLSLFAGLANRLSSLPGAAGCHPASLQALGKLSGSISLPAAVNPENTNSTYSDVAVRNAVCDLIGCVCDERPVLIIVEDAQHLDDASAQLLDTMLTRVSDKRLMITLCAVTEAPTQLQHHGTLHLDPLSAEAAKELWRLLLAVHEIRLPDTISQRWLDAAGGNAGHMELLVQQVIQEPDQFLIPVDLITLTDRRLSQLPANARYLLEASVILDDTATTSSAGYLTGMNTYDLLVALHALESGDWIINTTSGLRCRSGLIAERVRATSTSTVTSLMEGKAATYFENEQSGERWSPSVAWRIASHWQRAGEPRRARAYQRACWQHAVSIGQPATASGAILDALTSASDPEDRASLLDDLIGTLQGAGDSRRVVATVKERRTLCTRVHDNAERIAQLAFDEDEARILRSSTAAAHVSELRKHFDSELLDIHRRVRAARMLMLAADSNLDRDLALAVVNNCQSISAEGPHSRLLLSHISLIYHTIFGDADEALVIASDIQQQTKKIERSWYTVMSDRNCAFARQLADPGPSDYESFQRAFAQASDASMSLVALGHAGSLMSVYIDDGDVENAIRWRTTGEQLAETVDPQDWPIDYLGAQVDLSLLIGNRRQATRFIEHMERCASRYQSIRSRNDLFIYRLRVQYYFGNEHSPDRHIEQLVRYHARGKGLTRHDDHMNILWETLTAVGDHERASALLLDYLTNHRRERRPCRYLLRLRTQSDPAWALFTPSVAVSGTKAV